MGQEEFDIKMPNPNQQEIFDFCGVKSLLELRRYCIAGKLYYKNQYEDVLEGDLKKLTCMDKIKNDIYNYVKVLKKSANAAFNYGKIICFGGSHGVGKTLMCKILATSLNETGVFSKCDYKCLDGYSTSAEDLKEEIKDFEGVIELNNINELFFDSWDKSIKLSRIEVIKNNIKKKGKCVLVLCCDNEMFDKLVEGIPLITPLISDFFKFPDYSVDDLLSLSLLALKRQKLEMGEAVQKEYKKLITTIKNRPDFAYATTIKNLINKLYSIHLLRTGNDVDDSTITIDDINELYKSQNIDKVNESDENKIYEKKLNDLIGLSGVKKEVLRLKSYALKRRNDSDMVNLNFCFLGNPGTGKTEVANLLAGILYENGLLPLNKLVVADRSCLIAEYVGQTASQVSYVFKKALGGVLFIDEAYSLFYDTKNSKDFGIEALAELTRLMEDYKGQICVIFAGYKKETKLMIDSNPGLRSRINYMIDFDDYDPEELFDIGRFMLKKDQYIMDDELLCDLAIDVYSKIDKKNYGNARDMRNALEKLYLIQAERTIDNPNDKEITSDDLKTYLRGI